MVQLQKQQFTALLNNFYQNKNARADKDSVSFAKSVVKPAKPSSVLAYKLN